jgi:hypothetical protein
MAHRPPKKPFAKRKPTGPKKKDGSDPREGTVRIDPVTGKLFSSYDDETYPRIAKNMTRLGATLYDLADHFDVCVQTVKIWMVTHSAFAAAVKVGRVYCDERVKRSLYERAVGYTFNAVKILSTLDGVAKVPYLEHVPPDVNAAKFWLTNKRPEEFVERKEVGITGPNGETINRVEVEVVVVDMAAEAKLING